MNLYSPHEARLTGISYYPPPGEALDVSNLKMQSDIVQSDENQVNEDAMQPEGENVLTDLGQIGIGDMQVPFCVGEKITSFRQCVKRYSQHAILGAYMGASATPKYEQLSYWIHKQPAFPYMYGYDTDGIDVEGLSDKFNNCTFTLMNYLAPAYAGWRGSIRWKLMPMKAPCCSWLMEARRCGSNCNYEDNWVLVPLDNFGDPNPKLFSTAIRSELQADMDGGWDGSVATSTQHNPILEFTIPYYNVARFLTIPQHTATASSEGMGWWFRYSGSKEGQGTGSELLTPPLSVLFNSYVAAGS